MRQVVIVVIQNRNKKIKKHVHMSLAKKIKRCKISRVEISLFHRLRLRNTDFGNKDMISGKPVQYHGTKVWER